MAYEEMTGPLGPERGDMLHGIQTAALVNVHSGKRGKKARPQDFIPKWDGNRQQSPDEQLSVLRQLNARYGGTTGKLGR